MTNLIRWQPVREMVTLRDAMDRLLDDAFTRPWRQGEDWLGSNVPAVDMYQTADDVIIKAALPGIKPEAVQISITGDMLTLKAESRQKSEVKKKAYHIREQPVGTFERSIAVPTAVMSDKAKAYFEDGVLTISLSKAEEARPKTITIKAK
jgi:HSP20 family protein